MGKGQSSQLCGDNWTSKLGETDLSSCLTPYTKINPKWIDHAPQPKDKNYKASVRKQKTLKKISATLGSAMTSEYTKGINHKRKKS